MRITRYGKCAACKTPVKVVRAFAATTQLFPTDTIAPDLAMQLKEWREQELYCDEHNDIERAKNAQN